MTPEAIEAKLRTFVEARAQASVADLRSDTKIFSSGLLDSLTFIELVLSLEDDFKIKLANGGDVSVKTMDSMQDIIQLVLRAASKSA